MQKEEQKPEKPTQKDRSFTVALAQVAQILRSEIKLKDRDTKVLSSTSPSSINNLILQIAKLLRSQIHTPTTTPQKRSWKHTPPLTPDST